MSDAANGYKQYIYVYDGANWVNTVSGNFPAGQTGRSLIFRDPSTGIVYAD